MSELVCPVCGSNKITSVETEVTLSDSIGGKFFVSQIENTCSSCGVKGDFAHQNDERIQAASKALKEKTIETILSDFSAKGITYSSVERLLGLPQRTLSKWKNNAAFPHGAGSTLLKYVYLFPWLLSVAEAKFDSDTASKIEIMDAISKLLGKLRFEPGESVLDRVLAADSGTTYVFRQELAEPAPDLAAFYNAERLTGKKPEIVADYRVLA